MRLFAAGRWLILGLRCLVPLALAGCSTTYELGGLLAEEKDADVRTSLVAGARREGASDKSLDPEADLAFAKAAAAELFVQGGTDASLPWENPATGARGTVTRLASSYGQGDGKLCHGFLASRVRRRAESWYQGEACQRAKGWEVRDIRPLQRT